MAVTVNSQTGSSSIYDPTLPSRIARGAPVPTPPITTITPGQGSQYDPSFGADMSPTPSPVSQTLAGAAGGGIGSDVRFPLAPWTEPLQEVPSGGIGGDWRFTSQQVDPRLLPASAAVAPRAIGRAANSGRLNVNGVFANLPNNAFNLGENAPQTAQAPAPATPQGWNLFTALGQALGHLLGYNAAGQPQGMSGLIRNPVQTAPTQTVALRMPAPVQQSARYQGRTLLG